MNDRYTIPYQRMFHDTPLEIFRLSEFSASALKAHRHAFYMLLWTTAGEGKHQVNHQEQPLLPGRVSIMLEGEVHKVLQYPADGWMVLFQPVMFRSFLSRHPAQAHHGLFSEFKRENDVLLDEATQKLFETLIPLMAGIAEQCPDDPGLQDLLSLVLLRVNQLYRPLSPFLVHPQQAEQVRKLKLLIERHFREEKTAPFYADAIGISARKLNELTMKLTGKLIQDLIYDRLLSEAESLLGNTGLTVKEVGNELGFLSQSHLGFFFKRRKGMTASQFRSSVWCRLKDRAS